MKNGINLLLFLVLVACTGTKPVQEPRAEETTITESPPLPEPPPKAKPKPKPKITPEPVADDKPQCPLDAESNREQILLMLDCLKKLKD